MKLRELGSILLIGALLLFAIRTLGNKKSDDNDAIENVTINITTEKIVIEDDLFSAEIDGIENN